MQGKGRNQPLPPSVWNWWIVSKLNRITRRIPTEENVALLLLSWRSFLRLTMLTPERLAFWYITIIEVVVLAIDTRTPKLIWKWLRISGLTLATLSRIGPVYRVLPRRAKYNCLSLSVSLPLAHSFLAQKLSLDWIDSNKRGGSLLDPIILIKTRAPRGGGEGISATWSSLQEWYLVVATSWKKINICSNWGDRLSFSAIKMCHLEIHNPWRDMYTYVRKNLITCGKLRESKYTS